MSYKNILAAVMLVTALFVPASAHAVAENTEPVREGVLPKVEKTLNSTVETVRDSAKTVAQEPIATKSERLSEQKDQVEARKAVLKAQLEERRELRKERLEGRMLAKCQNRQQVINELIDKSAKVGNAKLIRIQAFHAGIVKFYEDQSLQSDSYAAALENVTLKEGEAVAALEVMTDQNYDCEAADATDPAEAVRSVRDSKRESLKAYRDSVQELLKVANKAFADKNSTENETADETQ